MSWFWKGDKPLPEIVLTKISNANGGLGLDFPSILAMYDEHRTHRCMDMYSMWTSWAPCSQHIQTQLHSMCLQWHHMCIISFQIISNMGQQLAQSNTKENIKGLHYTCDGNPLVTYGFPLQRVSHAEISSMPWWYIQQFIHDSWYSMSGKTWTLFCCVLFYFGYCQVFNIRKTLVGN